MWYDVNILLNEGKCLEGKVKSPHLCSIKITNKIFMPYISFLGFMKDVEPSIVAELSIEYPLVEWYNVQQPNRSGLVYDQIDQRDSLTVYLARINDQVGHLVADCPEREWVEECFVYLDGDGRLQILQNRNLVQISRSSS